ncbi:hypothetical protein AAY42_10310 [Flagellimonas eckloniae]|uniref:Uncharacterized protein n=2 Tax=Flagellimonas eckloniae TaxID=346185 RepID=A0A0Q1DMK1_9FLAO|nr:hypothetical protein AAY42_10310 [Allomuricauda eckloniae]
MLELQARDSKKPDSAGNQRIPIEYEVIKENGMITNVLVYRNRQLYVNLQAISDIIIDFYIQDGKIFNVTTHFKDLPLEHIEKKFEEIYGDRNWEGLYFSVDFQHFTTVTLEKGMASTTRWESNPSNVGRYRWGEVLQMQEKYKKEHSED